ncbi:MAG: DUF255 domain-containing protein [Sulfurimonadaceae bacterium]
MRKIVLMVVMLSSMLFASPINWEKDYKTGVAKATKLNKPILFISSRHSCKYCVILDKTTLIDPKVVYELNRNFVSIISYSDEDDYMPKELWRPGTPAIWFLDETGEPLFQPIMGAVDAKNFMMAVDIVKKEYIKRLKLKARNTTIAPTKRDTNTSK